MRVEEHLESPEALFVGGGEMGSFLRSHNWSQTPLGAVETWTDGLKTAVQILLTELDQAQQPEKTQLKTELQRLCNGTPTAPVEPTPAEAEWRESEAKYRMLLESLDEGFCLCELLFDKNGEPNDYRFLEVNAAFERLTGLEQAIGKTIRELVPNHEAHWLEIYGRVVRTREPARFEQQVIAMNRWFDVHAFCLGEPQSHQFAALFTNISDAKRIEAERQKVEQERDRFLVVGAELQVITSSDGCFQWVSPAFERILGWTPAEMTARPWTDFLHPDDLSASVSESVSLFSGTETFAFENRYRHKDGSYRWLLWRAQPYLEAQVLYGAAVDITERKQAELEIQKFVSLADNSGEFIGMCDMNFVPFYVNSAGQHLVGLDDVQQYIENSVRDFFFPEDQDFIINEFLPRVLQEGRAEVEIRFRHFKTGAALWMIYNVFYLRDENNQPIGLATVSRNITERKQTEAVLQESEELKRRILESSKDCIKVLTLEGRLLYVNTGGLHLLNIDDPASILNTQWLDFWLDEERQSAAAAVAAAKAGNVGQFQGCSPTAKGNLKWWDVIVTPIRDASGIVAQLLSISRDITNQKQAELEREQLLKREQAAREEAERANRIKDEFLAVLSHELRSPLNPILGWTRLLRNGKLNAARQADALVTIERNAKLQAQLIEDLLDTSRIMQGKLTLTATPVSLAFVISAAVETVRLAAEAKQIAIALDLDQAVASVFGDASRLQQVVWNLLTNAVKFTPDGGKVTVELRQVGQLAQIRVLDTGIGIKAPFLPYVFEYFRQEDGSTTRRFGGLGLGLAIVRQIVTLHGGTVTAESQGEQGATFTVQLPTLPQTTPIMTAATDTQSDSEQLLDNVHILLVDDDTDTREFETFLLEQQGATVTAVDSGFAALQALEQSTPAVIISDVGMPDMDGYQFMQQLRLRPPTQGGTVPAIALTAYAADIDQKRAAQAGFQRHLTKPLEPERFVSTILSLLKPNQG